MWTIATALNSVAASYEKTRGRLSFPIAAKFASKFCCLQFILKTTPFIFRFLCGGTLLVPAQEISRIM